MLPPLSDLHRIECWLLHHGLHKMDPPAGAAPAWFPLRKECIADLCHGGIENGAPARTCTSNLRLRRAACMNLLHLGSEYPRQDSHLRRELRKLAFFLLNYGDE